LISTFLNQEYYNRQIGSTAELKEKQQLKKCTECNNDVHGPMFDKCSDHIPNAHRGYMKDAWTRTGIDCKSPTYLDDCRKFCRERLNIMMGKANE